MLDRTDIEPRESLTEKEIALAEILQLMLRHKVSLEDILYGLRDKVMDIK